jgi:hypothetical protein
VLCTQAPGARIAMDGIGIGDLVCRMHEQLNIHPKHNLDHGGVTLFHKPKTHYCMPKKHNLLPSTSNASAMPHLSGQYRIESIDPRLAAGDRIPAVPARMRRLPEPIKKIIGDLSNEQRVLVGLDVQLVEA